MTFSTDDRKPSDMLAKLTRELHRAADASFSEKELVDHVENCCLTAWHMTDYVWAHRFAKDRVARKKLFANQGRFKEYVTKNCPELALCQDIANGFKHVIATPSKKRRVPGVDEVTVSVQTTPPGPFRLDSFCLGAGGLGGPGYQVGGEMYKLEIRDTEGNTWNAIDVLHEAARFWTLFRNEHSYS